MTVSELKARLDGFDGNAQVVLFEPHCCGDSPDFQPLDSDDINVIPPEGRRRSGFAPTALSYALLGSVVDETEYAGSVLFGSDEN